MAYRRCVDCGTGYLIEDHELDWKIRCKRCFIRAKNREAGGAAENRRRWLTSLRERKAELSASWSELLPGLIQLSHPDKHGGSALATKMTRRLLEIKRARGWVRQAAE